VKNRWAKQETKYTTIIMTACKLGLSMVLVTITIGNWKVSREMCSLHVGEGT